MAETVEGDSCTAKDRGSDEEEAAAEGVVFAEEKGTQVGDDFWKQKDSNPAGSGDDKFGKQYRKQTCIVKLDGCHYTIVANTVDGGNASTSSQKPKIFPRTGSLTVLRRTMSGNSCVDSQPSRGKSMNHQATTKTQAIKTNSFPGSSSSAVILLDHEVNEFNKSSANTDDGQEDPNDCLAAENSLRNLSNMNALPPADKPEALHACAIRLKELVKKLLNDESCKEELLAHLEYAARACENIYIVENSKLDVVEEDDVLGVVEPDSVPREVREWLTMTFTRTAVISHRQRGDERFKFRSVANAIRAGIMVDRIYRRTSSLVCHDAPSGVQTLMRKLDDWSFDVFAVSEAGDGHALHYVGYELLHRYDLPNKFKIGHQALVNFLLKLETGYSKFGNPYHNLLHAADVTQTTNVIFTQSGLSVWMTDLEVFATLISALIHDYEHTGTTNTFHINTNSDVALLYNDRSVLENYHVSASFRLMKEEEFNILAGLRTDEYREFRALVIELVLATDMSNHFQQIKHMRSQLTIPENLYKSQVLSLIVHCADISHPAKDWNLHHRWTERLLEEFFRQGDRESALGLQISPLCDRSNTLVPESQIGFIDFIVEPTFCVMSEAIDAVTAFNQQQCVVNGGGGGTPGTPTGIPCSDSQGDLASPGKSQKLKECWNTCLADNKSRWKDRAAKESAKRAAEANPAEEERGGHEDCTPDKEESTSHDDLLATFPNEGSRDASEKKDDDKVASRSQLVRQDDVTSPTESANSRMTSIERTPSDSSGST